MFTDHHVLHIQFIDATISQNTSSNSNSTNDSMNMGGASELAHLKHLLVSDPELQDQDKIFSMFHRLHRNSEYEGSGIGLGIVKKAVEDHSGKVWVVSHLGQGATFYFTIPKNLKDAC